MRIDDLDVQGIAVFPAKANSPLIVNANAVLTGAVALELFEPVARRHAKVVDRVSGIDRDELSEHRALELGGEAPNGLAAEETLGISVGEGFDHSGIVTRCDHNVKRYCIELANARVQLQASQIRALRAAQRNIRRSAVSCSVR